MIGVLLGITVSILVKDVYSASARNKDPWKEVATKQPDSASVAWVSVVVTAVNVKTYHGVTPSTTHVHGVGVTQRARLACSVIGALESVSVNPTLLEISVICVNQELPE